MAVDKKRTVNKDEVDFDKNPQLPSLEDEQSKMFAFMARYNTNMVSIAGTVRSKYQGEAKPKIDKTTNEHILVDDVPQFWDPFRSVTIAFDGGEMDINLDKEKWESIVEGQRYLFEGVKGLNYGKVQDKFHMITKF